MRNVVAKKISEERTQKKPTPADEYVGTALHFRSGEVGLTQMELARAIGVTFQQVQKYESGTSRISAGRLSAIAQALQVPVTYFFEAINGSDVRPRTLDLLKLPGASALLRHYANIEDPAIRRSVLKLARSLGGQEENT